MEATEEDGLVNAESEVVLVCVCKFYHGVVQVVFVFYVLRAKRQKHSGVWRRHCLKIIVYNFYLNDSHSSLIIFKMKMDQLIDI